MEPSRYEQIQEEVDRREAQQYREDVKEAAAEARKDEHDWIECISDNSYFQVMLNIAQLITLIIIIARL